MNFYPEVVESGAGNAPIVLHPTGGTKLFADLTPTTASPGFGGYLDKAASSSGAVSPVAISQTPLQNNEFALFAGTLNSAGVPGVLNPPGYTALFDTGAHGIFYKQLASNAAVNISQVIANQNWAACLALFGSTGIPSIIQTKSFAGTYNGGGVGVTAAFDNPVLKGSVLVCVFSNRGSQLERIPVVTGDTRGNTWATAAGTQIGVAGSDAQNYIMVASSDAAGLDTISLNLPSSANGSEVFLIEIGGLAIIPSGIAPIRGQLNIAGRSFAAAGGDFDEVLTNGAHINWGKVANDSKPVTMAASPQQLLLASAGTAYVFDLAANVLTTLPGATFSGPVSQAGICDGFFLLTVKNSKTFYVSAPLNANDWITNGNAIVSVFPNNIVAMWVFQRQVWFFSDTQSVVYYDSGNIFPFDVNPNAFIEAGSGAQESTVTFNNTIGWFGADARGKGKFWTAQGYTPVRISNHAVEFAVQSYAKTDDCVGFSYQDQGHDFACWYFPTPSVLWTYDSATGMWHRQGFWVAAIGSFQAPHRQNHVFSFGRHLVGDWQSSKIYEMHIPVNTAGVWTFADDDGAPLHRIRRAPHISKEQKRVYIAELQVYVETGIAPANPLLDGAGKAREPSMDMRLSRDGGHTWSDPRTRGCGFSGQFASRVRWLRLGQARDFVIEVHVSDPIGWRITDAYIGQEGEN